MLIGCVCSRSQAPEDFLEPGPDVRARRRERLVARTRVRGRTAAGAPPRAPAAKRATYGIPPLDRRLNVEAQGQVDITLP